jgi:ubiquinone/menaquinone biosynthesis C-methylase UbiE
MPEPIEQQLQTAYTTEAQHYDRMRFTHAPGKAFDEAEQQAVHRLLGVKSGERVLDVGAGAGRVAAFLAAQGLRVTALDLTYNMLRVAQQKVEGEAKDYLSCVQGTARQLPFASDSFDGLVSVRMLHLLPEKYYRGIIQEMWRVIRPGGVLLVQFDSALAAGIPPALRELYRTRLQGRRQHFYLWPHQVSRLFPFGVDITVHGTSPIGAYLLHRFDPGLALQWEELLAQGDRTFLAHRRVFVRLEKPSGS